MCFCLSRSVSVKDPVLRDTLSSSSAFLSGMRLPEVHGVITRSDFRSFDMRLDRLISEASLALEILIDKLHTWYFGDSLGSEGSGS